MISRIFKILILISFFAVLFSAEVVDKYTNKKYITVRGEANRNVDVDIFVNGKKIKTVMSDVEGKWLADGLRLQKEGINNIYAIARNDEGTTSKTSTHLSVVLDQTSPKLYSSSIEPNQVKPKDKVTVTIRTDDDVKTISLIMPDNSTLELMPTNVNNEWRGEWVVPKMIAGGDYNLLATIIDRAGNLTQASTEEIIIDAMPSLVVTQPLNNTITYEEIIPVKGFAKNSRFVLLNSERYNIARDFAFSGYVKFPKPGRNQIIVQAYDSAGSVLETQVSVIRLITFDDIQRCSEKKEIEYLATLGFIEAYPNSRLFLPEKNITRAELAALLVRIKNLPLRYDDISEFKDVKDSFWASRYIDTANKFGIVEGYPGNIYRPQNYVTRAEAAAMLTRFANVPISNVQQDLTIDVKRDHWGAKYIAAFKSAGLQPPGWEKSERFYPGKPITRAEVAASLARIPEINRAIEELLGQKTEWNYVVENPYDSRLHSSSPEYRPVKEISTEAPIMQGEISTLVIGVISPQEVVAAKDAKLTVASLVKLKQAIAKFPDNTLLPLTYDKKTDLWEGNWKIPQNFKSNTYNVEISCLTQANKPLKAFSNDFVVVNKAVVAEKIITPDQKVPYEKIKDKSIMFDEDVEFTYPEFHEVYGTNEPAGNQSTAVNINSGAAMTRAKMTQILAKYNKLRVARVVAPPAADVSLINPYVKTIKSGIVTGIVPNLSANKFYPDKKVTVKEANQVLKKLKIKLISTTNSNDYLSESEFDSWLNQSVK